MIRIARKSDFKNLIANKVNLLNTEARICSFNDLHLETAGVKKIKVEFSSNVFVENEIKMMQFYR